MSFWSRLTGPRSRLCRGIVVLAMVLGGHAAVVAEVGAEGGDEAAADAWPMFRGVLAGTGRSAARITLPLAERWHRQLEKTAFEATPVVSRGRIFVGDLDGTFHCLDLVDGKTVWSFKTDVGFPAAAARRESHRWRRNQGGRSPGRRPVRFRRPVCRGPC